MSCSIAALMCLVCLAFPAFAQETTDVASEPMTSAVEEPATSSTQELLYPGQATQDTSRHWDLELMYSEGKHSEGLTMAKARIASDPTDPEAAWHATRFMFEIGEQIDRTDTSIDKSAFYAEMMQIAEAALAAHPDDTHIKFAMGVAIGRDGTYCGVLASLFNAKRLEDIWFDASDDDFRYASINGEERIPCDVWHGLGIFYRLVPDSWIVKLLAGTKGSLDKSLEFHTKSNTTCTDRIGNTKEWGATQTCIGTKRKDDAMLAKGKKTLQQVLTLTAVTKKDAIDHRHAQAMIDDPSIACGYSRDGQQEVDAAKLEAP
jgi:hypothetical protein